MREVLIHIHVPKCAGTSLNNLLRRNHKTGYVDTTSVYNEYQYDEAQIRQIVDAYREMTCLTGHKLSLRLPTIEGLTFKPFAVVRDPVQRFVSWYTYNKKMGLYWLPEAKTLTFPEFVSFVMDKGLPQIQNGQCRFLTRGSATTCQSVLDLSKEHSVRLVPLERLSEAVFQMQIDNRLLWPKASVPFANQSNSGFEAPEGLIKQIRAMNEEDLRLYEHVKSESSSWISKAALSEARSVSQRGRGQRAMGKLQRLVSQRLLSLSELIEG
jgi:hypothetical protein